MQAPSTPSPQKPPQVSSPHSKGVPSPSSQVGVQQTPSRQTSSIASQAPSTPWPQKPSQPSGPQFSGVWSGAKHTGWQTHWLSTQASCGPSQMPHSPPQLSSPQAKTLPWPSSQTGVQQKWSRQTSPSVGQAPSTP